MRYHFISMYVTEQIIFLSNNMHLSSWKRCMYTSLCHWCQAWCVTWNHVWLAESFPAVRRGHVKGALPWRKVIYDQPVDFRRGHMTCFEKENVDKCDVCHFWAEALETSSHCHVPFPPPQDCQCSRQEFLLAWNKAAADWDRLALWGAWGDRASSVPAEVL